jgi:hypothetical protein
LSIYTGKPNQLWRKVGNLIQNKGTKKYISTDKTIQTTDSDGNISSLKMEDHTGKQDQHWVTEDEGGDVSIIRHANDGRILAPRNGDGFKADFWVTT